MTYVLFTTLTADSAGRASTGVTVSGTNVYYSAPMRVSEHGFLGFQLEWTGTPTGTFELYFSDKDQPDRTTDADWKKDAAWTPTNPAGSAGSEKYAVTDFMSTWARVKYTNASGTGVLTGEQGTAA